jgi:hypothetical protein
MDTQNSEQLLKELTSAGHALGLLSGEEGDATKQSLERLQKALATQQLSQQGVIPTVEMGPEELEEHLNRCVLLHTYVLYTFWLCTTRSIAATASLILSALASHIVLNTTRYFCTVIC